MIITFNLLGFTLENIIKDRLIINEEHSSQDLFENFSNIDLNFNDPDFKKYVTSTIFEKYHLSKFFRLKWCDFCDIKNNHSTIHTIFYFLDLDFISDEKRQEFEKLKYDILRTYTDNKGILSTIENNFEITDIYVGEEVIRFSFSTFYVISASSFFYDLEKLENENYYISCNKNKNHVTINLSSSFSIKK